MAKSEIDTKLDKFADETDDEEHPVKPAEVEPQYRMVGEDRIPIAKSHGKLWESRKKSAAAFIKNGGDGDRWDVCLRYYRNDHSERVDDEEYEAGVTLTTKGMETENLVFANASAMVPAIYAKNPQVEMTVDMEDLEDFTDCVEKLVNVLIRKKCYPGVNLKPHARRAVLMTTLTNISYVEVGWTDKEESSEETLRQIKEIGKALQEAKRDEIEELEAKLKALEAKVDLLHSSGAWVKFRKPQDVLIDTDATHLDDAQWVMICESLSTEFVKVMYGDKNKKDEWHSIYKPTHVLKVEADGVDGIDNETGSFSMFDVDDEKTGKDYGYDDEDAYSKAQRTKVWYIWDKATRRVYLYADNDWKWPLWVWDDPYGYDNFFPIVPLEFYVDPTDLYARSETVMYLDQQDAVNDINNEVAKVRKYAVGKVIYNSSVIQDEGFIESFLDGTGGKRALGIKAPPDSDLSKAFAPVLPQSAHVLQSVMFDKQRILEAINRVSSVTDVMRGVEFKTNTTNKAIEQYQSNTQTRLDEKIDAVEDFIGGIGWKLAQLCVDRMDSSQVAQLIGSRFQQVWDTKPEFEEFKSYGSCQCVGGSTLKPTSATKKEQAIQIGQVLGQFANVTPVTFLVALKVMERAFDDIIITDADWKMIRDAVQQALQAQQQKTAGPQGQGEKIAEEKMAEVQQMLNALPPDLKKQAMEAIQSGTPIQEVLKAIEVEIGKRGGPEAVLKQQDEQGGQPPQPNGAMPPEQPPEGAPVQ